MEADNNEIQFSDGVRAVPLWMLDFLYLFEDNETQFMTFKDFQNRINLKMESDTIEEKLFEKLGFVPWR